MSIRQRLSSKWGTVLLLAVMVLLGSRAVGVWLRVRAVRGDAERLEDRIAELERDIRRQERLLAVVEQPDWLAYQARLQLNYKLPDEQVVVVYKKENPDIIGAVASASTQGEDRPLWRRLRDWLAGVVQW